MANLQRVRPRLYWALGILLVFDLALVVYLASPFRPQPDVLAERLNTAKNELKQKRAEVMPLLGMDQKLKTAQRDLDRFYDERFASERSTIAIQLGKLADSAGVHLSAAKYEEKASPVNNIEQMDVDADVDGQYLNDVRFINSLERSKMFFILDGVDLTQQQGGIVKLHFKMQTFLRT